MNELEQKRDMNTILKMLAKKNVSELSDKDLMYIINNTDDIQLLEVAEDEYVNRAVRDDNFDF